MSGTARNVGDDARSHRLVERVEQLDLWDTAHSRERDQAELPSEDRGEDKHLVALLREVAEAAGDDITNALGNRETRRFSSVEASLRGQQPHDLANEERVAFSLLVNGDDEFLTGRLAGRELDETSDLALAQARERNASSHRFAGELGQSHRERIGRARVDVAVGADNEQATLAELAGEELQEQERGLVRRVQVVQEEHERAGLRGARQDGGGRLEEAEARALRLEHRRLGKVGEELVQLGKELSEFGGARP